MTSAPQVINLEQAKAALAAAGQNMSDEQVLAMLKLIGSLGNVDLARAAVELLVDVQDAA